MRHLRHTVFLAPALLVLGACASTPDPAEICTAEWITPRATKAVGKIEKSAKSSLKAFSKVSEAWTTGKEPNLLQLWSLTRAVDKMKKELTRGQGMKDLKTVASTCNDPTIIQDSMTGLLKSQGISDNIIGWIEESPVFESIISNIAKPEPVESNG